MIRLIQTSTSDDNYMRYEVFTRNNDTYPLDMFNVTLLNIPTSSDYKENILFSEAIFLSSVSLSKEICFNCLGSPIITVSFAL